MASREVQPQSMRVSSCSPGVWIDNQIKYKSANKHVESWSVSMCLCICVDVSEGVCVYLSMSVCFCICECMSLLHVHGCPLSGLSGLLVLRSAMLGVWHPTVGVPSPLVPWLLHSMSVGALPGAFLCCPLGWSMACDGLSGYSLPYLMGVTGHPGAFPVCSWSLEWVWLQPPHSITVHNSCGAYYLAFNWHTHIYTSIHSLTCSPHYYNVTFGFDNNHKHYRDFPSHILAAGDVVAVCLFVVCFFPFMILQVLLTILFMAAVCFLFSPQMQQLVTQFLSRLWNSRYSQGGTQEQTETER